MAERIYGDDPQHPVNQKARARDRKLYVGAAIGAAFVAGYLAGGARIESRLDQCKEDEVWYPSDYTGDVSVEDLICVHQDTIATIVEGHQP